MSCMNPVIADKWTKPSLNPCRVPIVDAVTDLIIDYANLVNTVQRHAKCNSVYCLRVIHKEVRVPVFIILSRSNRDLQFSTKKNPLKRKWGFNCRNSFQKE